MNLSLAPKGRTGFRLLKSTALCSSIEERIAFVVRNYGDGSREHIALQEMLQKAAVSAATAGDMQVGYVAPEFFTTATKGAIVRKLIALGAREVPFLRRLIKPSSGVTAFWVGQAKPKPISKFALEGESLSALKVVGIYVQTTEAFRFADDLTEAAAQADGERATTELLDQSIIDPANTGIADVSPASLLNGVTPITSTGSPQEDLTALADVFTGDWSTAGYIMHPSTALRLALARDAGGGYLFGDIGPKGGALHGVPVITSRAVPIDTSGSIIALVDASAVSIALESMTMLRSQSAAIEMESGPTDPPTASTVLISLFQSDLIALKVEVLANWSLQRDGAAAYVQGVNYSAG
jgi:HK97 family phage major capsid protein